MLDRSDKGNRLFLVITIVLTSLLVFESATFNHLHYSKAEAQNRIKTYLQQVREGGQTIPNNSVLFFAYEDKDQFDIYEVDAMIVSQELNWPTINGYSGNFPPDYEFASGCSQISKHFRAYMNFTKMKLEARDYFYRNAINSVISIGPQDCD